MLTASDLPPRIDRLERLLIGLNKEVLLQQEDDLLLYVERREYLKIIRLAASAVETARLTLVKAKQRLLNDGGDPP